MSSGTSNNDSQNKTHPTQLLSQMLNSPVITSAVSALVTALVALVAPNAEAIATSIRKGIPLVDARAAIEQAKMWQKNFDCAKTQQIKDFQTATNIRLSVTVCPSGDMLVQLSESSKQANARWVSFESLQQDQKLNASNSDLLLNLFAPSAIAAPVNATSTPFQMQNNQILAQATVICQENLEGGLIRRVVKYSDGSCVIEEVNTFTGEVTRASGTCVSC